MLQKTKGIVLHTLKYLSLIHIFTDCIYAGIKVVIEVEHISRPVGLIANYIAIFIENVVGGNIHVGFEHNSRAVCIQLGVKEHTVFQAVDM